MLHSVARVGGQLRLTVLGPVGTVEGFDAFWAAACDVSDVCAPAQRYPHHSLGDAGDVASLVSQAGWRVDRVEEVVGIRHCDSEDLWRWLWGSLPILTNSGDYLAGIVRENMEQRIRAAFFARAERWRAERWRVETVGTAQQSGDYAVTSRATLVSATRIGDDANQKDIH